MAVPSQLPTAEVQTAALSCIHSASLFDTSLVGYCSASHWEYKGAESTVSLLTVLTYQQRVPKPETLYIPTYLPTYIHTYMAL